MEGVFHRQNDGGYDRQGWGNNGGSGMMNPFAELDYDIEYYNQLVAKEKKGLKQ
jgi:hypothetical protein